MDELGSEVFNLKLSLQEYEDRLAELYQTEDRSKWKGPATLLVSFFVVSCGPQALYLHKIVRDGGRWGCGHCACFFARGWRGGVLVCYMLFSKPSCDESTALLRFRAIWRSPIGRSTAWSTRSPTCGASSEKLEVAATVVEVVTAKTRATACCRPRPQKISARYEGREKNRQR